jgi:hypothetical protein
MPTQKVNSWLGLQNFTVNSRGDDVEVVGRAIVLVVQSTSQEFMVMHDAEFCSLDGVVGVKDVRDPVLEVVHSSPGYLDFISTW